MINFSIYKTSFVKRQLSCISPLVSLLIEVLAFVTTTKVDKKFGFQLKISKCFPSYPNVGDKMPQIFTAQANF